MSDLVRILLVEDNPPDARLFREQLREVPGLEFELAHVSRLSDALDWLGANAADIAFVDLSLPDAHALQSVERTLAVAPRLPIIVLTGHSDEQMAIRAVQTGAQDYLVKGADGALVVRSLRYALERKRAEEHVRRLLLEQAARAEAEAAERRYRFLSDASRILASSLNAEETLKAMAELAVSRFVDHCFVDLVGATGALERAADAHREPSRASGIEPFLPCAKVRAASVALFWNATDTASSFFTSALDERNARAAGLCAAGCVPLISRGELLGMVSFVNTDPARTWGFSERQLAMELADRAAIAVDNARLYRSAQEAIRARDDVLGIVSHDLRNPLTVVSTTVATLLRAPNIPLERRSQRLEAIVRAADRMNRLIQDLLDVSRIDAGSLSIEAVPLEVDGLIEEALDLLRPIAAERSVRIDVELAGRGLVALGDRERLLQVFSNLVGNAVKFTGSGGVVTVRARRDAELIRFEVNDTGVGIPPEDLPRIFDRFWKRRTSREGAGLGLAIVKGIVEAHGGKVTASPGDHGVGTKFFFTIPSAADPANVVAADFGR